MLISPLYLLTIFLILFIPNPCLWESRFEVLSIEELFVNGLVLHEFSIVISVCVVPSCWMTLKSIKELCAFDADSIALSIRLQNKALMSLSSIKSIELFRTSIEIEMFNVMEQHYPHYCKTAKGINRHITRLFILCFHQINKLKNVTHKLYRFMNDIII